MELFHCGRQQRGGVGTLSRQSAVQPQGLSDSGRGPVAYYWTTRDRLQQRCDLIDERVSQRSKLFAIHGEWSLTRARASSC
jgi:hypothetical protein